MPWIRQLCLIQAINAAQISKFEHFLSQSAPAQLPIELCQDSMLLLQFRLDAVCGCCAVWHQAVRLPVGCVLDKFQLFLCTVISTLCSSCSWLCWLYSRVKYQMWARQQRRRCRPMPFVRQHQQRWSTQHLQQHSTHGMHKTGCFGETRLLLHVPTS